MKKPVLAALLAAFPLGVLAEISGKLAAEATIFQHPARLGEQFDSNLTLSFQPRWYGEWNEGDDSWSVELFLRADGRDEEREHADIRELLWLNLDGDNEWRIGINTMYWGVTESRHLVDVINQVDQLEGIDGEDKLGQPMIHLKHYEDWGVIDALVLPGFRERGFRGIDGRPRLPLRVDTDAPTWESSDENHHIDYALRYSHTIGNLDIGLSWFRGTSREPELRAGFDANGLPVLVPHYALMTQIGLDVLWIVEDWTWKLEAIRRETDAIDFSAVTAGFEYTFYGVFGSDIDLGTLLEYSHDGRPPGARDIFDRDLFVGARLAFNDMQSSEVLAGIVIDTEKHSRGFRLEASRRLGDSWKLSLEAQGFGNVDPADPLKAFEDDDYLLIEAGWYF